MAKIIFASGMDETAAFDWTICCGLIKNRSICMANWVVAAGFKETAAFDMFFFSKFFFLFIAAYIKNRSKSHAADTFFPLVIAPNSHEERNQNQLYMGGINLMNG